MNPHCLSRHGERSEAIYVLMWRQAVRTIQIFMLLLLAHAGAIAQTAAQPVVGVADMGSCALQSGASIRDCRIAYTTVGTLNAQRDNAVLIPSWYGGRSGELLKYLGPDKLVDTNRFFVIVVDSFGNGVSSSPSNSATQGGAAFPSVSIRDMVMAQKRLLAERFGLKRLHAVLGISMGAMQTLEWAVLEPDMAQKFVAIAGSPRLATFDVVFWETETRLLQTFVECKCQRPLAILAGMHFLHRGPEYQALNAPEGSLEKVREDIAKRSMSEATSYDRMLQMGAMIGHDVAKDLGGDLARAAQRVGARLLVLAGNKDAIVTPGPVLKFAKLAGAVALEFPNCGHDIPRCSADLINPAVRDFLAR